MTPASAGLCPDKPAPGSAQTSFHKLEYSIYCSSQTNLKVSASVHFSDEMLFVLSLKDIMLCVYFM